jgi:hypothetical protein
VAIHRFTLTASGALSFTDFRDIVPATTPADATFTVPVPGDTPAGGITLSLEAFDTTGNSSGPTTRSVTVSDTVPPQVQITSPAQNAVLDPRDPISATVSATDAVGVTVMTLSASGAASSFESRNISPAATSRIETFTVNVSPLPPTGGSLALNASARDAAGNVGNAGTIVVHLSDVVPPDVTSTTPANGSTNVDPFTAVTVQFSEPLNPSTLNSSSVQLLRAGVPVATSLIVSGNNDVVTLTPVTQPLPFNTVFTIAVSTAVADPAGNQMAAPRSFTFTTQAPATTPPKVQTIDPADNAVDVSLRAPITVTFTEILDPASVTAQSFKVTIEAGTIVPGSFSFLNSNTTVRFTPTDPWPTETVVVTGLSSAITDRFGNALVANDGSPLTTPLTFTFLTGTFSLTSPGGSDVVENSAVLLEARASASLGVASVIFTVNGQAQPAASGPPFTSTFNVGSAASTATLQIVASARNASGSEVAHDERTFNVVVGLKVAPALTGVPLGGTSALQFSLSSALASDLPIALTAGDPALVSFPTNPVVLPAGQTKVNAVVAGVSAGATAVLGTSTHGVAAAIVSVSTPQSGQTLTPFATEIGLGVSNPPSGGFVIVQPASTPIVRLRLLAAPAATDTPVTVFSTNAGVATATASTILAGQQTTDLQISALTNGVATIVLRAGNQVVGLTIFVGAPPAGSTPMILASPVGLSISSPPIVGQVIAAAGRQFSITVQVLSSPAAVDTPVSISSDNPAVATATSSIIAAGQTSATITINTVADGKTTLTLRAGGDVRAVTVFVGVPAPGSTPLVLASPVGVSLTAVATLGRMFAPIGVSRTIGVRLFESPVASDTFVTVTTSDPTVATVTGPVVVHAGQQVADLDVSTGSGGTATLTIEAGGVRRELTLVVGSSPTPGTTPPIVAAPVGVTVMPNPSIGRVFGQLGAASAATLGIPLLGTPAATAKNVTVTSSNPSIANFGGNASTTLVINVGEQVLQLPISISGTQGAALLTIEFDGVRRELVIVVGNPSPSDIPAVTAPVVGVQVNQ